MLYSAALLAIAKLTPGQEGYYERSVAPALDDYYAGRGESPGIWTGRGSALLELEGALRIQEDVPESVTIFIAADVDELERRLRERATESTGEIGERIRLAREQLEQAHRFRYMVRNDDVRRATEVLVAIVECELSLVADRTRA